MRSWLHRMCIPLPAALLAVVWQICTIGDKQRLFFFSSPAAILNRLMSDVHTEELWTNIAYTGFAASAGLLIGTLAGSIVGIGLWGSGGGTMYCKAVPFYPSCDSRLRRRAYAHFMVRHRHRLKDHYGLTGRLSC